MYQRTQITVWNLNGLNTELKCIYKGLYFIDLKHFYFLANTIAGIKTRKKNSYKRPSGAFALSHN